MRGKVVDGDEITISTGITPAYAGKRESCMHPVIVIQDHPRLCGEKSDTLDFWQITRGSPPPMRGKVYHKRIDLYLTRITPAYAGKREHF